MKFLVKLLIAALLFGTAYAAGPGSVTNVTITKSQFDIFGRYWVGFSSGISNGASCATGSTFFVLDATTTAGAVAMAWLEEAYALGKTVSVTGTNTCTVFTGYENLSFGSSSN